MKQKVKLPTILGLTILVVGVIAGVFLINSTQVFKIGANVEAIPKNVRVTNITDNSATISWTTDIESNGFVKWGKSELSLSKVALEDSSSKSFVHSANLIGIDTGSTVSFKINSDSKDYDNEGIPWQVTTNATKVNSSENLIASGTALMADGKTPANALVYLSINGVVVSALTSSEGNYVLPLSNYFEAINGTVAIEVSVQAGMSGTSQAVIYPQSVKFIPAMILGRTYDFRTVENTNSSEIPQSSLTVPESVAVSSRFEVTKSGNNNNSSATVTVESIDEGEIITTVDPEFFGSAPSGTEIQIQVESELQEATIKANSSGDWSWDPPKDLPAGEHKLTVKWRDASGILRTLTRSFIVSAAEGPAFESTPSATPTNLVSSTPTATAMATTTSKASSTPTITSSPSSTLAPTPETGSLTPTLGLFILGLGILMSSLYVWNKSQIH